MQKFALLLLALTIVFSGCGGAADNGDADIEAELEVADYLADWNRVATYTDGADMNTGAAVLTFLDDGTFVSSTSVCTVTGDYTVNIVEENAPETMTMSYVQSDCPGFTVSSMTHSYEMGANEEGQETLIMNAEYMGHIVTEVYNR